jgi:hypothetical protein
LSHRFSGPGWLRATICFAYFGAQLRTIALAGLFQQASPSPIARHLVSIGGSCIDVLFCPICLRMIAYVAKRA